MGLADRIRQKIEESKVTNPSDENTTEPGTEGYLDEIGADETWSQSNPLDRVKRCVKCGQFFEFAKMYCPRDGDTLAPIAFNQLASASADEHAKICPRCHTLYKGTGVCCKKDGTLLMSMRDLGNRIFADLETVVNGFAVQYFIGTGSITRVYSMRNKMSGQEAVLKLLHSHLVSDEKTARRFSKKTAIACNLEHKNIAKTMFVGERKLPDTRATPYIVVEKLAGLSLAGHLQAVGHLAPRVVATAMIDVCLALQYANGQEIFHQDLKPSNIFLCLDGDKIVTKLTDFGLAERLLRNLDWTQARSDGRTASVYGDASYISADAAFNGNMTVETEVYSLGCVMYECISGYNPFVGTNAFDTLMKHREQVVPLFDERLGVPPHMISIIFRCLEKSPEKRYHTFEELKKDLQEFLQS